MPFACKGHGPEMSAVVNYGVALAKISLKAFRRPGGGMSPNRGVFCQKDSFSLLPAFPWQAGRTQIMPELLKCGREKCPIRAFLRYGGRFRAAKTGFLC